MTGELEFAAAIMILYAFECMARLRLGDLVIAPSWRGRYRVMVPVQLSASSSWGWTFLNPLWTGRAPFSSSGTHFAITARGILLSEVQRSEWRLVEFTSMRQVTTLRERVVLNEQSAIDCLSTTEAEDLARYIDKLKRASAGSRSAIIRTRTSQSFDDTAVRAEIGRFRNATRGLRRLSIWMFADVFVVFPALSIAFGFGLGVLFFIATALLTSIVAGVLHYRLEPAFDPAATRLHRWLAALHVALYPLSVIRCSEAFALRLLRGYEGCAIAYALGDRSLAEMAARKFQIQMRIARSDGANPEAAAALEEYRSLKSAAIEEFLRRIGSDLDALQATPLPQSPDCRTYCPRCFTQYQCERGVCADCDGALLRSLSHPAGGNAIR